MDIARHQSLRSSVGQFRKSKAFTFTKSEFLTTKYLNFKKKIYMYIMIKNLNHQLREGGAKVPSMEYEIQYPRLPKDPPPPPPTGSFPSVTSIPHVERGSSATMGHSVVSGKTAQYHYLRRPLLQHHWSP